MSFTITVPAGLHLSKTSGTVTPTQPVTITVTVVGNGPSLFDNELTIDPGQSLEIEYEPSG